MIDLTSPKKPFIFSLYRYCLYPIGILLVKVLAIFKSGKLREMVRGKSKEEFFKSQSDLFKNGQDPIWIHAASGEIEYARPLIREIKKDHPEIPILVTYSSPSAKKILASIPEIDAWGAMPWDTPWACHKFLLRWRPRICLWSRTDVWPEMSYQLRKFQIPSVLFAATFAKNSTRLNGIGKGISLFSLANLQMIFCVDKEDEKNLLTVSNDNRSNANPFPTVVMGDTRFDQVMHRLANPKKLNEKLRPQKTCLVLGSTWPEDEAVLISGLAKLLSLKKHQVILAPHELHEKHLRELKQNLDRNGISYQSYTDQTKNTFAADVLLVDQVGILAELYTWGDIAFVGGSFKKLVHSVMEPLAAGLHVFVGPHFQNNREALLFSELRFDDHAVVQVVHNSTELVSAITSLTDFEISEHKAKIKSLVSAKAGSSRRVLTWIYQQKIISF